MLAGSWWALVSEISVQQDSTAISRFIFLCIIKNLTIVALAVSLAPPSLSCPHSSFTGLLDHYNDIFYLTIPELKQLLPLEDDQGCFSVSTALWFSSCFFRLLFASSRLSAFSQSHFSSPTFLLPCSRSFSSLSMSPRPPLCLPPLSSHVL